MAQPQLVIAFDFGRRRIGVACGDTLTATATAQDTIETIQSGVDWARIETMLAKWRPTQLVVGLPYNVDGSDSTMTAAARAFAAALANRSGLAVDLTDERYSSIDAQARLQSARAAGTRKRRTTKGDLDSAAACVILERWFRQQRP